MLLEHYFSFKDYYQISRISIWQFDDVPSSRLTVSSRGHETCSRPANLRESYFGDFAEAMNHCAIKTARAFFLSNLHEFYFRFSFRFIIAW